MRSAGSSSGASSTRPTRTRAAAMAEPTAPTLLRTAGLTKHFRIGNALTRRTLHAVDDVDMVVGQREIVALAGESGSGKSTIARLIAKLYAPTRGEIFFRGTPLSGLRSRRDVLRYRGEVPMFSRTRSARSTPSTAC